MSWFVQLPSSHKQWYLPSHQHSITVQGPNTACMGVSCQVLVTTVCDKPWHGIVLDSTVILTTQGYFKIPTWKTCKEAHKTTQPRHETDHTHFRSGVHASHGAPLATIRLHTPKQVGCFFLHPPVQNGAFLAPYYHTTFSCLHPLFHALFAPHTDCLDGWWCFPAFHPRFSAFSGPSIVLGLHFSAYLWHLFLSQVASTGPIPLCILV